MCPHDDHSAPRNPNFLQRQLERARFERALEVAESMVQTGAFLNTAELGRINNVLRGSTQEPWRDGPARCKLPSGREESLQILADPINRCKEILTNAKNRAAGGEVIEAAADVYSQLVLSHVFQDANRRTGAVAAAYLLKLYGFEVSAMGLHELGLGDLRAEGQIEALREMIRTVVKMSPQRPVR